MLIRQKSRVPEKGIGIILVPFRMFRLMLSSLVFRLFCSMICMISIAIVKEWEMYHL